MQAHPENLDPADGAADLADGTADTADGPADPAAMAALVAAQRAHVVRSTNPDARLLYGVWGAAWLVGFGLLWLADRNGSGLGLGWAYAGFGVLMLVGVVVTAVHLTHRSSGLSGASRAQRQMLGWTWGLSFGVVAALNVSLGMGGASDDVMTVVTSVVPVLVVGALYMAGGALWGDSVQFGLGVWVCLVAAAGALSGPGPIHLVMAVAGGGGLLIGALVYQLRRGRTGVQRQRPGSLP
jgi:hypothetical protein